MTFCFSAYYLNNIVLNDINIFWVNLQFIIIEKFQAKEAFPVPLSSL